MKTRRERRIDQWRVFGAFAFLFFAFIAMLTGCATVPVYDSIIPEASGDSVTFIPIHIENHRTVDAIDPHFYLIGSGTHPLGIIKGFGGRLDQLIDTRWLSPDGSFTIRAHFSGGNTYVFERAVWRPGYRIVASLDNIFIATASWSHP